jgi:hypothetical protein
VDHLYNISCWGYNYGVTGGDNVEWITCITFPVGGTIKELLEVIMLSG